RVLFRSYDLPGFARAPNLLCPESSSAPAARSAADAVVSLACARLLLPAPALDDEAIADRHEKEGKDPGDQGRVGKPGHHFDSKEVRGDRAIRDAADGVRDRARARRRVDDSAMGVAAQGGSALRSSGPP